MVLRKFSKFGGHYFSRTDKNLEGKIDHEKICNLINCSFDGFIKKNPLRDDKPARMISSTSNKLLAIMVADFQVNTDQFFSSHMSIITCSYTSSAWPKFSGNKSSTELTATPPHASVSRSMFLLLARRRAIIPSAASKSSETGSMPFWLMSTKLLLVPSHTFFFSSMIFFTFSSVKARSAATNLSLSSALLEMLAVKMNASLAALGMSGCLDP
ncbi:hypothetical protein BpHYR1_051544 [Brachionus plicatilis]|uniref:Uncharacterized protein n=1 Tax=Brachionus plicatilis TaxID=10195 RepID=A0A3M7Q2A6_BRAPC|nr:hypothetical protein BpHYR1_051544 [Brachionus plicatilis]